MSVWKLIAALPCCVAPALLAAPERSPESVTDADDLAPFFEAAATRRVDVVCIGDSNQLQLGHGWDHAWILASHDRFTAWATSLLSPGENNGNGGASGEGWRVFSTASTGQFSYNDAPPTEHERLADHPDFAPMAYLHVPANAQALLTNHGILLDPDVVISPSARLDFVTTYAIAQAPAGPTIRPYVRRSTSPYSTVRDAPAPTATTGMLPGVASYTLDIPEAPRDHGLQCMLGRFNTTLDGPATVYSMRLIDVERTSGLASSTFYGLGSRSARDMARALDALPDATLTLYFQTIREQQGSPTQGPRVLVRINTGLNDLNEEEPPPSAPALAPSSADAYEINLRSIIDRIKGVWADNGWPEDELFFLLTPSHATGPVGSGTGGLNNDDARLVAYRQRAEAIAQELPRVAAFDFNRLYPEARMASDLLFRSNAIDRFHLRDYAYRELASFELTSLQNGRSWYDANDDGAIDPEDLYTLEQWSSPPDDAPHDLSAEGLREAVRYNETADALSTFL